MIPVLVMDQEHEDLNCAVIVVFDNYKAGYDVVKLLISRGYNDIGFISSQNNNP